MAPLLMELKMQMRVDGGVSFAYKRGGNEGTMDADEFRHAVSESIINLSNSSPEIPPRFFQDSSKIPPRILWGKMRWGGRGMAYGPSIGNARESMAIDLGSSRIVWRSLNDPCYQDEHYTWKINGNKSE